MKRGVIWEDRAGMLVAIPDTLDPTTWTLQLLGGATLMEATTGAPSGADQICRGPSASGGRSARPEENNEVYIYMY